MKFTNVILAVMFLCGVLFGVDKLSGSDTSESALVQNDSRAAAPAPTKHYFLGQSIPWRKGFALRVVAGSAKSKELLSAYKNETDRPFVVDLEFDTKPGEGEALLFRLDVRPDPSEICLIVGDEKVAPKAWGWSGDLKKYKPAVWRVQPGLRSGALLGEGTSVGSLLFDLKENQFQQKKSLILNFSTLVVKTSYSFVIDLNPTKEK